MCTFTLTVFACGHISVDSGLFSSPCGHIRCPGPDWDTVWLQYWVCGAWGGAGRVLEFDDFDDFDEFDDFDDFDDLDEFADLVIE